MIPFVYFVCVNMQEFIKRNEWMDTQEVYGNGLFLGEMVWKWELGRGAKKF